MSDDIRSQRAHGRGRTAIVVVVLVSAVIACGWILFARSRAAVRVAGPPAVLYVEEPRFESSGRKSFEKIRESIASRAPHEQISWRFVLIEPQRRDLIEQEIKNLKPAVVLLANVHYLSSLPPQSAATSFLVPSERTPEALQTQYGDLRHRYHLAFVSWYAPVQFKLIEYFSSIRGRPVRRIAGFFDPSASETGLRADFRRAARALGVEALEIDYETFDEFRRRFDAVVTRDAPDAVFLPISREFFARAAEVAQLALDARVLAAYSRADQVEAGGLLAIAGPDGEVNAQLARYIVLMVHGADASQLSIATPSRFKTMLNLRTAEAMGIPIPAEVLIEAEAVVY